MRHGLAIVNMLLFVIIFSLLAASMLSLASSSTRQIESDIRRIRGFYAAEAAYVEATNRLRAGLSVNGTYAIPWGVDDGTGAVVTMMPVNVTNSAGYPCGDPIFSCNRINSTAGYVSAW
jgi:Tfp pilus assembly protein PilX